MPNNLYNQFTYYVTWTAEDNEYVGLCTEFPSLSWLEPSPEEALKGIRQIVASVIADMETNGEPAPEPIALKKYSGKFIGADTTRITPASGA